MSIVELLVRVPLGSWMAMKFSQAEWARYIVLATRS